MGEVKLPKDSPEVLMFRDYWKLLETYWISEVSEEYWDKVVADSKRFYERHKTPFALDLVLSLLNELERKNIPERNVQIESGYRTIIGSMSE